MENKEIGIYVHIPFCKRKCDYCDFISYSNKDSKIEEYTDAVKKEIQLQKIKLGQKIAKPYNFLFNFVVKKYKNTIFILVVCKIYYLSSILYSWHNCNNTTNLRVFILPNFYTFE